MSEAVDWAALGATLLLGFVGIFVARGIRRDVQVKVAERRLAAYERLWALMRPVSPNAPPANRRERHALNRRLTDWYYENGNGMMLENASRTMYLRAKDNLVCPLADLVPQEARDRIRALDREQQDTARGTLAARQFSLLRTQLKSDVEVFGTPYGEPLKPEDRAFLVACTVNMRRKPWRSVDAAGRREYASTDQPRR